MAAPHVAGAAALLRQRHRAWSVEQIKSALVQTGRSRLPRRPPGGRRHARRRWDGQPRACGRPTALRIADRSLLRLPGSWSYGTAHRRPDGRGRRKRRVDGDCLPATAGRRLLGERAGRRQRSGRARRDRSGRAGSDPGRALGIRRPHTRRRPKADPVLVPRRGPCAWSGAGDAADANRHVQRRHARPPRARQLVPLSGRSPGARGSPDAPRAGAGVPGIAYAAPWRTSAWPLPAAAAMSSRASSARATRTGSRRARAPLQREPLLTWLRGPDPRSRRRPPRSRRLRHRLRQHHAGRSRPLHLPVLDQRLDPAERPPPLRPRRPAADLGPGHRLGDRSNKDPALR